MTRKRKETAKPKKLDDFFPPWNPGLRQDGAGAAASSPAYSYGSRSSTSSPGDLHGSSRSTPGPSSPLSRSPAKSRPQLEDSAAQVSPGHDSINDTRELVDPFTSFPTSGTAVSDTVLKDMLVSLLSSMHGDMLLCMKSFKADIGELGDRVAHVEEKIGEFAAFHNTLIDAHSDHTEEITWLRAKDADLEDRSRRNNVKIRGVPETVLPAQLQQYARDLLQQFLPSVPDSELQIDRIHRLPKPSHLPDNVPRDVLMRVHFFQVKDQLVSNFRKSRQLLEKYAHIQLFADISQFTMQKRKSLLPVTKALRNHSIPYRWGYPVKITVTHDGKDTVVSDLEAGLTLLRSLDILPDHQDASSLSSPPTRVGHQNEWQTVMRKKSSKKAVS